MRAYLFNDVLLLTKYKSYKYDHHVDLAVASVKKRFDRVVEVYTGGTGSILDCSLVCDNSAQCDEWVRKLEAAVYAQRDKLNDLYKRTKRAQQVLAEEKQNDASSSGGGGKGGANGGKGDDQSQSNVLIGSMMEHINVFMRVRPFTSKEEKEDGRECIEIDDNLAILTVHEEDKERSVWERVGVYDHVFGPSASQADVYVRVGQETLGALFAGYNSCVLVYGNTGAGKTYTMFGDESQDHLGDNRGLVPRLLQALFVVLDTPGFYEHKQVSVSYLQVYNNQLQDLQSADPMSQNLNVMTDGHDQHVVRNLIDKPVKTWQEAMKILDDGNAKRVTRSHKMNEVSSRSHAVFLCNVEFRKRGEKATTKSTLYLVDLAGSENAKDTGATGDMLVECKHINQSLNTLGRVVNTIVNNKHRSTKLPVPFRDSKLTQLLQDVLCGDFVCSLILNASISPVFAQDMLTAKTMAFGAGVKKLTVQAKKRYKEDASQHWLAGVWRSVTRAAASMLDDDQDK
eukprot:TRINITY_DN60773_c0_g4_i1.p1 TRINITY_DN60773_c0_g4~~TRINITY_DN60773_c0_g4_i1.p1  ORF type:complete len:538 (-),score=323.69 TRINITY_DN60773_c0_g4_i1:49-1584(-)